jgi:quinol monooxygenase YgiN
MSDGRAPGEVQMRAKQKLMLAVSMLLVLLSGACRNSPAEDTQRRVVRIAELEIDPAQLESYKALLREEIETSIRVEPGVLTLYAVSLKNHPAHIRIFETYTSVDAYNSHVRTAHFQKYKTGGRMRWPRRRSQESFLPSAE